MKAPQQKGLRKVAPPRVDLTPMVDLGFLLITFFMFTTALAKPKTMVLQMPADGPKSAVPLESTITIIPGKNHKLILYKGSPEAPETPLVCGFRGKNNLRARLVAARQAAAGLPARYSPEAHRLHVVIKPDNDCTYKDVVDLLDEMTINEVPYYTILPITPAEKDRLKTLPGY